MGREATGSPRWSKSLKMWTARVTLPGNTKREDPIPMPGIAEHDREAAIVKAKEVSDRMRNGGAVRVGTGKTVSEWCKDWLKDRELRKIATVGHDKGRLDRHILPTIGTRPIADLTREDIEKVVDALDAKVRLDEDDEEHIGWKTASNAWTIVTTMCKDAVSAKNRTLRQLKINPADGVRGPERGEPKAKQYLYPSEFLKLVSCEEVPLKYRVAYVLATYTYARAGELVALQWDDVDLEHKVIHITKAHNHASGEVAGTKSKVSRRVPIEPALLPLLTRMHEERPKGQKAVVWLPDHEDRAIKLREHLEKAKVTRPQLYENDARHKHITWHDLRATGITWCAVRGDDPLRIKQRAGHATFSTTEGYIREAENLREGFGEPFPTLPFSAPQLPQGAEKVRIPAEIRGATGDRNPSQKAQVCSKVDADTSGKQADPAIVPVPSPEPTRADSVSPEPVQADAVLAKLEARYIEHDLAGRDDQAAIYLRRIEAHKAARPGGTVLPFRKVGQ